MNTLNRKIAATNLIALFALGACSAESNTNARSVSQIKDTQKDTKLEQKLLTITEEMYVSSQKGLSFTGTEKVCADRIARATFDAMNKRFQYDETGIETVNINSIELIKGKAEFDLLKVYRVSASDEVEPSAWLVVTDEEDCVIEFIAAGSESQG